MESPHGRQLRTTPLAKEADPRTPVMTLPRRLNLETLELVQTPLPFTINIFNQLLSTPLHPSNSFFHTPYKVAPVSISRIEENFPSRQFNPHSQQHSSSTTEKKEMSRSPKEGLKSCNCLKSNCLKKYCDCYKFGQGCSEECGCVGCKNTKPKSVKTPLIDLGMIACNCKKSGCLKNYCECRSAGVGCSELCHCMECMNCKEEVETPVRKRRKLL